MRIRKRYNESFPTSYIKTGAPIVPVFSLNEDGNRIVITGKRDIRQEIDSFAESTDINIILHQLNVGNSSIIERIASGEFKSQDGSYFDSTVVPKTLEEARKLNKSIKEMYLSVPENIRNEFNGIDDFVSSSDDRIQSVIDKYTPSEDVTEEVKGDVE